MVKNSRESVFFDKEKVMAAVGIFNRFVQNVSSIQGLTQAVNGYFFLQDAIYKIAKVFNLSRIGTFVSTYKLDQMFFLSGISSSHRILLIYFNIHRPKSLQGYLKIAEQMGSEVFFLIRKYLPVSVFRNTIGDCLIGIPYVLDGLYNIQGEKTIHERTMASLTSVRDRVLLMEVQTEHTRDLLSLQQRLEDSVKVNFLFEELKEKREMLLKKALLDQEDEELRWLKTVMTETKKNSISRQKSELEQRRDHPGVRSAEELEQIRRRLIAIGYVERVLEYDNQKDKANELKTDLDGGEKVKPEGTVKIVGKKPALEAISKSIKEKKQNNAHTLDEEKTVKTLRYEIKVLEYISDPVALDEALSDLEKLREEGSTKLIEKQKAMNLLISYIEETFISIGNREKIDNQVLSLRQELQKSFKSLTTRQIDVKKLKLGAEVESKFNAVFDVGILEGLASKLILCNHMIYKLQTTTANGGILYEGFDEWLINVTKHPEGLAAVLGWRPPAAGKSLTSEQKIAKKDLYLVILAEVEAMEEQLIEFENKIMAHHRNFKEEFKDFKAQMTEYFSAVRNIFTYENKDERDPKFKAATLDIVQPTLLTLRRALQKEQNELVERLKSEQVKKDQEISENPSKWRPRFERYTRPYLKLLFGVAILGVRFFKSRNWIATHSHVDLLLDIVFMGSLAVSHIAPLLFRHKIDYSREIVVVREKDLPRQETISEIFQTKMAAVKNYIVNLKLF